MRPTLPPYGDFSVTFSPMPHDYLGWWEPETRTLRMHEGFTDPPSWLQFAETLLHEIGHVLLQHDQAPDRYTEEQIEDWCRVAARMLSDVANVRELVGI